jgi:hypothetical protein
MEARAWGNSNSNSPGMNAGDRREYIANVLMTKVRIYTCSSSLTEDPSSWRGIRLIPFILFFVYRKL